MEDTLSEGSFVRAGSVGSLPRTPHGPHLAPGASWFDANFFQNRQTEQAFAPGHTKPLFLDSGLPGCSAG